MKPWYKYPQGRSRLARERLVAALYCPKLIYGPLTGTLALRGQVDLTTGSSGIVRAVKTRIEFTDDYPARAPRGFVLPGQFEPQTPQRHFRGDRSCCLWFARAEDGWDPGHPHAFDHFLQQLLVFFDRQLTYDAIGEFPGAVWEHTRPIAENYIEDRLEGDAGLIETFKQFRRGAELSIAALCPCRSGDTFGDCHRRLFVDLRIRLAGLKFIEDPREVAQKRE